MSTLARGGANSKEKMGASPSDPHLKKPLKSPSSSSSSDHKPSHASSEKPVPNYLKPTQSSLRDVSDPANKPNTHSSANKSSIERRRSFDKPPSSFQLQKALHGAASINLRTKPVRSTSFSSTTKNAPSPSSSSKPISERLSKPTVKDAKTESSFTRSKSMRKSTSGAVADKKKKAPKSVTSESSVEAHDKELSLDHLVVEGEAANTDHEVESLHEISEMPGEELELGDPPVEAELKNAEQDKEKAEEDEEEGRQDDKHANLVSYQVQEEANNEEQTPTLSVEPIDSKEEVISEHQGDNVEKLAEQEVKVEEANADEKRDENVLEAVEDSHKEEVEEGLGNDEKKEEPLNEEANDGELGDCEVKEMKTETQNASSSTRQLQPGPTGGKKEAQVYNDVIEETASKLMENRKNKVRALAGAFETVISLQETK